MGNTTQKVVELIEKRFSNSNSHFETKLKNEYLFLKQYLIQDQQLLSSPKKQKKESQLYNDNISSYHKILINSIKYKKRFERFGKWIKMAFPDDNVSDIYITKSYKNKLGNSVNIYDNSLRMLFQKKLKNYYMYNKLKFNERISKGPPDSLRWISWCILMNISEEFNETVYKSYLNEDINENVDIQIKKDLNRTLNEDSKDINIINNDLNENIKRKEKSLYNVLRSLAKIDPVLGYCQGINFIAGFLLTISEYNETETYYMLISLFSKSFDTNYNIRGFFIESFPLLDCYLYIFDNILTKELPHLNNHIQHLDVPKMAWIGKWIQTLFTICLPHEMNIRVWDSLLSLDLFFIISFSVCILQSIEKHLMKLQDAFDFTEYLKNFFNSSLTNNSIYHHNDYKSVSKEDNVIHCSHKNAVFLEDIILNAQKKHKIYKSKNYFVNLKEEYILKVKSLGHFSICYNLNILCNSRFSSSHHTLFGLNNISSGSNITLTNFKSHFSEEEKIESSYEENLTNKIMNDKEEEHNGKGKKLIYMMDSKQNDT